MEFIQSIMHYFSMEGIQEIIAWGGLAILFFIIFSETGLLVGFFLPGDSLLIVSGFMAASTDVLDIWQVLFWLSVAAVVGDSVGYAIGRKAGKALYEREQSRWFRKDHLLKTKAFYEKYGGVTIILARFMPFIRTFAPTVAGVAEMEYKKFISFNCIGGISWVFSMVCAGYFFGQIPFVQRHLEKALVLVIVISVLPVAIHAWKEHKASAATPVKKEAI
ncbi:VTT domain-containing protein [bacterium]|nr:VTT domain-containing protein [bacterium]